MDQNNFYRYNIFSVKGKTFTRQQSHFADLKEKKKICEKQR